METCFKYDFQKICRACKTESSGLQPVFTRLTNPDLNSYPILSEMLMACASIQVAVGDGLPTAMCEPCIQQLILAYNFKIQCETTDTSLRLFLNKGCIIKQEDNQTTENDENVFYDDLPFNDSDSKTVDLDLTFSTSKTTPADSLTCKFCMEKFEILSHLQKHMRRHTTHKIFVCTICDKRLTRLEHLKRHMVVHLKTKPHTCRVCKRGFNHLDNLNSHQKRCKGDRLNVCEICNRGFNRPDSLIAHMSNHDSSVDLKPMLESLDNIERYIKVEDPDVTNLSELLNSKVELTDSDGEQTSNELCSEKESVRLSDLLNDNVAPDHNNEPELTEEIVLLPRRKRGRPRKGEVRHTKTRLKYKRINLDYLLTGNGLTCRICQKKFKRTSHLKRHFLSHAENKPFICNLCSKTFNRRDHMLRHIKLHSVKKEFKCDLCLRAFVKEEQLVQHKAVKHNIGERTVTEKKYKCNICFKSFTTEKYRDTHVKAHSEEKEKVFSCKTCKIIFPSKLELNNHEKKSSDCSKKYLCSECGQRFIRKNYLVVHMRRHRGEKPFKCKFCGKGFPRSTDVTRHEKYHTGEKNHLCIVCGKGFGRAYNLTLHMRTHTGEKPYACTYCDAAFAQSNDLKAHVRRHTGERYHCDLCTDAFLMGYLLKQHKRNVHGIEFPSHRVQPIKNDVS